MNINTQSNNIDEAVKILAEAFIKSQQEASRYSGTRDNLVDFSATPSIHAGTKNTDNIKG